MCSSPNLNWVPNWNQSNFNCERKPKYFGVWSLDRMALDRKCVLALDWKFLIILAPDQKFLKCKMTLHWLG
jgi:hypothetical protein